MNLELNQPKKNNPINLHQEMDEDFDFKPITSGLGFHHQKTSEIKSSHPDLNFPKPASVSTVLKTEVSAPSSKTPIYQNDLSLFYGHELKQPAPATEKQIEKHYRLATNSQRIIAYVLDLAAVLSFLFVVLTIMARLIHMDLLEALQSYPHEITPLVLTLFVGFYLMYFSIFEKTDQSTIGKSMVGITVLNTENKSQNFSLLLIRSFISLANFISLGLFSYFDLQNKIAHTKVVRKD